MSFTILPACGAPIFFEYPGEEGRYRSEFIGAETGNYIIIKNSPNNIASSVAKDFVRGRAVIVKYHDKERIVGFRSKIIDVATYPGRLLFLSFPEDIETFNLRKHARYDCSLEATLKINDDLFSGMVKNISVGGCCFVMNVDGPLNVVSEKINFETVQIDIQLLDNRTVSLQGKVIRYTVDNGKVQCGIAFDPEDGSEAMKLLIEFTRKLESFA